MQQYIHQQEKASTWTSITHLPIEHLINEHPTKHSQCRRTAQRHCQIVKTVATTSRMTEPHAQQRQIISQIKKCDLPTMHAFEAALGINGCRALICGVLVCALARGILKSLMHPGSERVGAVCAFLGNKNTFPMQRRISQTCTAICSRQHLSTPSLAQRILLHMLFW